MDEIVSPFVHTITHILYNMQSSTTYTNIAFISYKREDEKWAKWLQNKLEYYKLPTEIRNQIPDLEFAMTPRQTFDERRNSLIFNAYKKTILRIDTILFPNKNKELLHGKIEGGRN